MRFLTACALACVSAAACADRLINIPTARKIQWGTYKFEYRAEPHEKGVQETFLGIGVTEALEVQARASNLDSGHSIGTLDVAYNFISPITGFTPGFAVGVLDVLNKMPDGRRPYFVTTFKEGFYTIDGEVPADITLGFCFEQTRMYPMVGVSIPFSSQFRTLAEHDGKRLSAGVEARPAPNLGIRFTIEDRHSLFGLQYQHRF